MNPIGSDLDNGYWVEPLAPQPHVDLFPSVIPKDVPTSPALDRVPVNDQSRTAEECAGTNGDSLPRQRRMFER